MKITKAQCKKLLEYSGHVTFKQLAINMAFTRLKKLYRENLAPETLDKCTSELNALLEKFAVIMKDDYNTIVNL